VRGEDNGNGPPSRLSLLRRGKQMQDAALKDPFLRQGMAALHLNLDSESRLPATAGGRRMTTQR
jgi:hypothetical protein